MQFKRLGLMLLFIVGAIACYTQGASSGFAVFIGLGVLLELGFWLGVYDYMLKSGRGSAERN